MLREMFVIGAESESVMMRWALRLLSVFTEAQSKVQAEIDQIIGPDRDINWDDRHQLPITRATLAEIQRFADIAPTAVGHKVMYDVDFHGFHLPKVITTGYPDANCKKQFGSEKDSYFLSYMYGIYFYAKTYVSKF